MSESSINCINSSPGVYESNSKLIKNENLVVERGMFYAGKKSRKLIEKYY